MVRTDGAREGRIKRRAQGGEGGYAHFKRERADGKMGRSPWRAREKRSMSGGKNVHRNLYNEEFHYAGLDIHDTLRRVYMWCMRVRIYTYIYVYRNIERRVSSTEIRSVYICRQPSSRCPLPPVSHHPPPAFSSLCMNHDALVSSPWNRFFVSSTFVESSSRRERNHPLTLRRGAARRAIGGSASSREVERASGNERASDELSERNASPSGEPDNAQR